MIEFTGFPGKMRFTPIPNIVFSSLLPGITDITELKALLYVFEIIYPKKGSLRFVTEKELLDQTGLASIRLLDCLASLIRKGVLMRLVMHQNNVPENIYLLNTEANRMILSRIQKGEEAVPGPWQKITVDAHTETNGPTDVFSIYEQNIGILTPLIAEELKEARDHYPETWIRDAIKEAAALNKRNWRYISRILEHWSTEGKDDGTYRGYTKKDADPGKYTRGKYGHMVQ
jgi:DNA replication protein